MIKAVFYYGHNGFLIEGHSTMNPGSDVVCAAISAATSMAIRTIQYDSMQSIWVDDEEEVIQLVESPGFTELTVEYMSDAVIGVIESLKSLLSEIQQQYPEQLEIFEEE